jgi:fluoride exporter
MLVLGIAALGGVGAVARICIQRLAAAYAPGGTPTGTLALNVAGAFLLGALVGADVHGDALVLAGTGLLGSFTTFSGWMLETIELRERSLGRAAVANVGVSLVAGLAAVVLGRALL